MASPFTKPLETCFVVWLGRGSLNDRMIMKLFRFSGRSRGPQFTAKNSFLRRETKGERGTTSASGIKAKWQDENSGRACVRAVLSTCTSFMRKSLWNTRRDKCLLSRVVSIPDLVEMCVVCVCVFVWVYKTFFLLWLLTSPNFPKWVVCSFSLSLLNQGNIKQNRWEKVFCSV